MRAMMTTITIAAAGAICLLAVLFRAPVTDGWQPSGTVTLVVVAGQSNAISRAPDGDYSVASPVQGIFQLARSGSITEQIIPAYEPLQHWEMTPNGVGFAFEFAKRLRKSELATDIVLVPAAKGQASLSSDEWGAGGMLNRDMVARVNSVARRLTIGRCIFLWHQGEAEVVRRNTRYATEVVSAFDAMRAGAEVLKDCTFLIGGLADDFLAANDGLTLHSEMQSIPATTFIDASGLKTMDGVHFDSISQLELGARYFAAYAHNEKRTIPKDAH